MKKLLRRILSVLLVLAMGAGLLSVTAIADEKKLKYVALGDSYSQGFMFHDYDAISSTGFGCSVSDSYVHKFAKYLDAELIDLTIRGMRPVELYNLFMPDYAMVTDWDIEDHFTSWKKVDPFKSEEDPLRAMSETYRNAVRNADIITFDLGMSDFGIFGISTITDLLGEKQYEVPSASEYISLLDKDAYDFVELLRGKLHEALGNTLPDVPVADIIETLVYAYVSYIVNFENCIEYIYAVNPDVELIVLPLYNPLGKLNIVIDENTKIDISVLLDILFESANLYTSSVYKYASLYKYAYYDDLMPIFADELYYYDSKTCTNEFRYVAAKKLVDSLKGNNMTLRELLYTINNDSELSTDTVEPIDVYNAYEADSLERTQKQNAIVSAFDKILAVFEVGAKNRDVALDSVKALLGSQTDLIAGLIELMQTDNPNSISPEDRNLILMLLLYSTDGRGYMTHPAPAAMNEKYDAVIKAHESKISANGTLLRVIIDTVTEYNEELGTLISELIDNFLVKQRSFLAKLTDFLRTIFSVFDRITALTSTVG